MAGHQLLERFGVHPVASAGTQSAGDPRRHHAVGVNFDAKQGDDLAEDIEALNIRFAATNDPSYNLGISRPDKLPTTVIITPQGTVADVLVGPQTEDAILASLEKAKVAGQKNADPSVGE